MPPKQDNKYEHPVVSDKQINYTTGANRISAEDSVPIKSLQILPLIVLIKRKYFIIFTIPPKCQKYFQNQPDYMFSIVTRY